MTEVRNAVRPLHEMAAREAVPILVDLMADYLDWSAVLADDLEAILIANPRLSERQRLLFTVSDPKAFGLLSRQIHRWPVAAALTMHPSGYVRERALNALVNQPEGYAYILNRQSDWVPTVARKAKELASAAQFPFEKPDAAAWRRAITGAHRSRGTGKKLLAQLMENPEARLIAVTSDSVAALYVLSRIQELPTDDPLVAGGLASSNVTIRTAVAKRLRPDGDAVDWAVRLFRDPAPAIRLEAIRIVGEVDRRHPLVQAARLDANVRVRAQARITMGEGNHLAFYRSSLPLPAAIEGIGETGKQVDAPALLPFLTDPKPRVRHAAVRALGFLDARETVPALKKTLGDPSTRVVREVIRVLGRLNSNVDPEEVAPHLVRPGTSRVLLRASALMSRWDGGVFLLRYGAIPELREVAIALLRPWADRTFLISAKPRGGDLPEFRMLIESEWIPADLAKKLRAIAQSWTVRM